MTMVVVKTEPPKEKPKPQQPRVIIGPPGVGLQGNVDLGTF